MYNIAYHKFGSLLHLKGGVDHRRAVRGIPVTDPQIIKSRRKAGEDCIYIYPCSTPVYAVLVWRRPSQDIHKAYLPVRAAKAAYIIPFYNRGYRVGLADNKVIIYQPEATRIVGVPHIDAVGACRKPGKQIIGRP